MIWTHDEADRRFQPDPTLASSQLESWDLRALLRRYPLVRWSLVALVGLGFLLYLAGLDLLAARSR